MNIFNRIIVVLIMICIICVSIVAIFNEFVGYFKWSDFALEIFNPLGDIPTYITVLALIAVFAISIIILMLEFYRRKIKVANISSSKEGNAMITLETIAVQIKNEALKIEGLEEIKVKVIPKATGIIINMNTKLKENLNIPEKMQEIINKATAVASDKLGIKVIKANLTIVGFVAGRKEKEEKEIKTEIIPQEGVDVSESEDENVSPDQDK